MEKFAVISDIHGNLEALETVLTFLGKNKINKIICLGDTVGYGPNPNECIKAINNDCSIILRGDHESMLIGETSTENCSLLGKLSYVWTKNNIYKETLNHISSFKLSFENNPFLFVHSSYYNPIKWPYIYTPYDLDKFFPKNKYSYIFLGHTHRPQIMYKNKLSNIVFTENITYERSITLNSDYIYYINVGSVGQSRDSSLKASFVICYYNHSNVILSFHKLDYNHDLTYNKILLSGLDKSIGEFLIKG